MKIKEERHYNSRATDHKGKVVERFVTIKRGKMAALKSLRKEVRKFGQLWPIVTNKLRSNGASPK